MKCFSFFFLEKDSFPLHWFRLGSNLVEKNRFRVPLNFYRSDLFPFLISVRASPQRIFLLPVYLIAISIWISFDKMGAVATISLISGFSRGFVESNSVFVINLVNPVKPSSFLLKSNFPRFRSNVSHASILNSIKIITLMKRGGYTWERTGAGKEN